MLDSITSDSVCRIAADLFSWNVEKRSVKYEELQDFDEVFAAGTAASLVPIKSITMRSKGDKIEYLKGDEPGPVCLKLLKTLQGIQRGLVEDTFGWNERVERPEGYKTREVGVKSSKLQNVHGEVGSAEVDQLD